MEATTPQFVPCSICEKPTTFKVKEGKTGFVQCADCRSKVQITIGEIVVALEGWKARGLSYEMLQKSCVAVDLVPDYTGTKGAYTPKDGKPAGGKPTGGKYQTPKDGKQTTGQYDKKSNAKKPAVDKPVVPLFPATCCECQKSGITSRVENDVDRKCYDCFQKSKK